MSNNKFLFFKVLTSFYNFLAPQLSAVYQRTKICNDYMTNLCKYCLASIQASFSSIIAKGSLSNPFNLHLNVQSYTLRFVHFKCGNKFTKSSSVQYKLLTHITFITNAHAEIFYKIKPLINFSSFHLPKISTYTNSLKKNKLFQNINITCTRNFTHVHLF